MTNIKIKHIKEEYLRDFSDVIYNNQAKLDWVKDHPYAYTTVATVTYNYCTQEKAMNNAFSDSQNLEIPWINKEKFSIRVDRCRSTSVGDIFEIDGTDHMVDLVGFCEVS